MKYFIFLPGGLIEFSLSLKSNGFTRIFLRHKNYSPQYSVSLDSGLILGKFFWILVLNITSYSLFQVSSSGTTVILVLNLLCLTSISTTFFLICFTYFLILFLFAWLFISSVPCFLLFLLLVWFCLFLLFFFSEFHLFMFHSSFLSNCHELMYFWFDVVVFFFFVFSNLVWGYVITFRMLCYSFL